MYTLEKINTSPLCILCTILPQTIPLLTLMLVCRWYEESTPREPVEKDIDGEIILGSQNSIEIVGYQSYGAHLKKFITNVFIAINTSLNQHPHIDNRYITPVPHHCSYQLPKCC